METRPTSRKHPKSEVNERTASLVQLLAKIGPDIPEIGRRLGEFKESVRYRYKAKILDKGIAVQAIPDQEKLGLRRIIMIAEFAETYAKYAQSLMAAMNDLCYIVGFAKTLPGGSYIVDAAVPKELVDGYIEFLGKLKEKGLFSDLQVMMFDWYRNPPMRAEQYDFDTGRWDYDWSEAGAPDFEAAAYMPSGRQKFDRTDLLIMRELHIEANQSLTSIAEKLGINYKKLAWHYNNHVLPRGLIKTYRLNWMGTRYDYATEKAHQRSHRYFLVELLVRNVHGAELMALRAKINALPFLWSEAVGESYDAQIAFPIDFMNEGLQFLATVLEPFRTRAEYFVIDQTNALAFTISDRLYDESTARWQLDEAALLQNFDEVLLRIREGRG
ncbi:MAG TPA: hypothetical protein VLY21_05880 [Nitrososphaerales archaeon]|nr:hypothetical protein [Nitrososphaerales archaeon]